MILKLFFILITIYIYYIHFINVKVDVEPDIVISPGGYNGFYQLGVCHYIKNNFNYENKKILGFSSGSWVGLFMCLHNKYSNDCIRNIFKQIDKCCPLPKMPGIFQSAIEKYNYSDFNLSNLNIGLTNVHSKSMYIHNHFLNVKDCVNCCIGSSFVPYVTYRDLFYFYNNKCVVDGGLYYKTYGDQIDKNKVFELNYKVFRPLYNVHKKMFINFRKPKRTLYQLYIYGYKNAQLNHDYLKRFFHSDS